MTTIKIIIITINVKTVIITIIMIMIILKIYNHMKLYYKIGKIE